MNRPAPRQRSRRRPPRTAKPAGDLRTRAFRILQEIEDGGFADALLGETLQAEPLEARDAALLTRLVYGVTAWQARLDWTLAPLSSRPFAELDPPVRAALRLGLHQLLFLDRVPDHAAVSTSVNLVKAEAGKGASGMANAILRRVLREGERAMPEAGEDIAQHLAVRFSHPTWLVCRWLEEFGEERTRGLLAANQEAARTTLRSRNPGGRDTAIAALRDAGIRAEAGRFAPAAIDIDAPRGRLDDATSAGLVAQGEASQLVACLLAAGPRGRLLDLCAAPGGKTEYLRDQIGSEATVLAADPARAGVRRLKARGLPLVVRADGRQPPLRAGWFEGVLVDAPCSGLGTLRGHPEIRWRRTADDVARLAATQREILDVAARLVRPGGRLVYATCTLLSEENEDVRDSFLAMHPEFEGADARASLPEAAHGLVDSGGALRTAPDRDDLDGFFACVLQRKK